MQDVLLGVSHKYFCLFFIINQNQMRYIVRLVESIEHKIIQLP